LSAALKRDQQPGEDSRGGVAVRTRQKAFVGVFDASFFSSNLERVKINNTTMKRTASAAWRGGLKEGKGTISTESGVLAETQYSFSTRFENGRGTNPEELIAAAHAGCFSMALSAELGKAGLTPDLITTSATLTMERLEGGWTVTEMHLEVTAKIPGADRARFEAAAQTAKAGCPISRLLNAKITMDAKLES